MFDCVAFMEIGSISSIKRTRVLQQVIVMLVQVGSAVFTYMWEFLEFWAEKVHPTVDVRRETVLSFWQRSLGTAASNQTRTYVHLADSSRSARIFTQPSYVTAAVVQVTSAVR